MRFVKIKTQKDFTDIKNSVIWLPLRRELMPWEKILIDQIQPSEYISIKTSIFKHFYAFLFKITQKTMFFEPFLNPFVKVQKRYQKIILWRLEEFQRGDILKRNKIDYDVFFHLPTDKNHNWTEMELEYLQNARKIYTLAINISPFPKKTIVVK